ncbi:glycosyltransferase [Streptomyces tremellae]|uniref:DUF1205 domain-containing protein n=1 Tax=Streptomyces tremellae TaxID=1124239 RepID=A0ABP7F1A4_9ACTN
MRILFATWTAPGHLYPWTPLAWAFRAQGHDVMVAAPAFCHPQVHGAGLPAVAVGPAASPPSKGPAGYARSWGSDRPWPDGWTARPELLDATQTMIMDYTAGKQIAAAAGLSDDLVAYARWWRPDLVVCDTLCFAGPVAAAAAGVPHLAVGWELATVLHAERAGRVGGWLHGYSELFERFGLDVRACSERFIDSCPPSLRIEESFPVERTAVRYVPFNGPGTAPGWLSEQGGRPRVCVTSGVALDRYDAGSTSAVIRGLVAAVDGLGVELVVATAAGGASRLDLPADTRVAEGVPFHLLLPHCAAVVHHGGAGTAMTAVATGTPQLVLPQSPMYAEIGHRVARAGAGAVLAADSEPEQVGKALAALLDSPRHIRSLAAVRAEMDGMPAPAVVAERLAAEVLSRP